MSAKTFSCQYTNKDGDLVTTNVVAYSEAAAIRTVMLKHPLAHNVKIAAPAVDKGVSANNRASDNKGKLPLVIALGVASFVLAAALVVFFSARQPADGQTQNDPRPEVQKVVADRYAEDYRNIVSISTKNTRSTGFKVRTSTGVYLYTCFHCLVNADTIVCRDSRIVFSNLVIWSCVATGI